MYLLMSTVKDLCCWPVWSNYRPVVHMCQWKHSREIFKSEIYWKEWGYICL